MMQVFYVIQLDWVVFSEDLSSFKRQQFYNTSVE